MSPSVSDNVLADRYQLIEPIGAGGMAEVHRAWDAVLRRHVAIKLFQPGFDPAAAQRFDNEVRVLAALSHPALVSVYDADTTGPRPFVVMRLVEGRTLHDRMTLGPVPVDEVRTLGARLADALAHVHAHGLVHRDVKPANILLDQDDDAYLADFGLAHLTGATRLTRTNQLVGTAAYLAPEQVLGGDVDHPTDVYALGLVLLECLTGRREYPGSEVEAAVARLHRPPVVPVELPADLRRLLAAMTASAPEDRPTAHECARVLGAFPPAYPAPAEPDPGDPTEELPRRAGTSWKALVASAGAMAGAFAITLAALSGDEPATPSPPGPATQQAEPKQAVSSDTAEDPAQPRFLVTPRAPAPSEETTSAAPTGTPAGDTPEPVTDGGTTTTANPVPTTTPQQQPTTSQAPTATQSPSASPDPVEPPAEPTGDGNPNDGT
ncbi:protein kinase [Actinosynnema sp. NPDC059335]|uniref:serine/threonine-protein kinase n=1 Tax=Actinosynnema sp. NPDC059335 TaxID=3346804 RepID=UPI003670519E